MFDAGRACADIASPASRIRRDCSAKHHDDAWLKARFADVPELLETLGDAEQVLPPGARFHYSNLAFRAARRRRGSASPVCHTRNTCRERLLTPLGLTRTTVRARGARRGRLPGAAVCRGRLGRSARQARGAWVAGGAALGHRGATCCTWASFSGGAGCVGPCAHERRGDAHHPDDRRSRALDGRATASA